MTKPYTGTAEDVIERLRTYMAAGEALNAVVRRLAREWPIPDDARAAETPARKAYSDAFNDLESALANYDYHQNKPK